MLIALGHLPDGVGVQGGQEGIRSAVSQCRFAFEMTCGIPAPPSGMSIWLRHQTTFLPCPKGSSHGIPIRQADHQGSGSSR